MENTIRTRRIHFSLLFDWKSDLGQSWTHLRDILGRLGKIFEPSWPSTWVHLGPQDGSWAAQEPPERSLQNTQEASWSQEPPKSRPEPSKTPQGGAQTPSKPRFSRKHGGGNAAFAALKIRYKKIKNVNPLLEINLTNLNRQFLHAKTIGFIHPKKNQEMIFNSILPQELEIILKTLRNKGK